MKLVSHGHTFNITKTKIEDSILFRITGENISCLELEVIPELSTAILQQVSSHSSCSVETLPESGIGTMLLEVCFQIVKMHKIKRLDLSDNSTIRCNLCEPVLNIFYMLTSGETWYEKHGFRLDDDKYRFLHSQEKARMRKIQTKSVPLKSMINTLIKKYKSYCEVTTPKKVSEIFRKNLAEIKKHKQAVFEIIDTALEKLLCQTLKKISRISCCLIEWLSNDLVHHLKINNYFGYNFVKFFRYRKLIKQ